MSLSDPSQIVQTGGGSIGKAQMAVAGVRSSGEGLELVQFPTAVPARGRLELWVCDLDRQLVSALARDLAETLKCLNEHGNAGPGRPPILQFGSEASSNLATGSGGLDTAGGTPVSSATKTPGNNTGLARPNDGNAPPRQNGGATGADRAYVRRPTVQGHLLVRSAHWTGAVEGALALRAYPRQPPLSGSGGGGGGGDVSLLRVDSALQRLLTSILLHVNGWSGELREPGGTTAYASITNTALITQALQQRDVVEELLRDTLPARSSPVAYATVDGTATGDQIGATAVPLGNVTSTHRASSQSVSVAATGASTTLAYLPGVSEVDTCFPFNWICHLRHYYIAPSEATAGIAGWEEHNEAGQRGSGAGSRYGGGEDNGRNSAPPVPPPLLRVSLGPWNIPYGFEYGGTLERLWLTPLSERCLLHAVHSAKVQWRAHFL